MRMGLGLGLGMYGSATPRVFTGAFAATKALPSAITLTRANNNATYVDASGILQTAAANVARFTHDPTSLASLGLMIEEQRTNILTHSKDLSASGVSFADVVETHDPVGIVGPDGAENVAVLTAGATTVNSYKNYTATVALCSATVFMKLGNIATRMNFVGIYNVTSATHLARGRLNLGTGAWTWITNPGANGTSRVTVFPNGWYRVSISYWGAGITIGNTVRVYFGDSGSGMTIGDYNYFDCLQIEEAASPSSYIPTNGAAATRGADVATMTFSSSAFADLPFTIQTKWRHNVPTMAAGADSPVFRLKDGAAKHWTLAHGKTGSGAVAVSSSAGEALSIAAGNASPFTDARLAMKMETNSTRASLDGAAVVADTTCTVDSSMTTLLLGCDGTEYLNGTIAELNILKRGHSDAELQAY